MQRKIFWAAAVWYGLSQGLPSFVSPYLPLYFTSLGFTPSQIGLLSALRPWISAPFGSIAAAAADQLQAHRLVLIACFLATTALQGSMALVSSFPAQLALTIAISAVWTGSSIIGDAAVMAASTHAGDYGRLRTWASVAWIAFAPISGWVNESFGVPVGIVVYAACSLFALPAAWLLPVHALQRGREKEVVVIAPTPPLEVPLLAEEAPAAAAAEPLLARAIAIVKFVEAITELGAVPPPGALYGFAEVATPYAERHLHPPEDDFSAFKPLNDEEIEGEEEIFPLEEEGDVEIRGGSRALLAAPVSPTEPSSSETPLPPHPAVLSGAPSIAMTISRAAGLNHATTKSTYTFTPEEILSSDDDGGDSGGEGSSSAIVDKTESFAASESGVFDQSLDSILLDIEQTEKQPELPQLRLLVPPPPHASKLTSAVSAADLLNDVRGVTGATTTETSTKDGAEHETGPILERRSSALQRLTHIFTGWGPYRGLSGATPVGSIERVCSGSAVDDTPVGSAPTSPPPSPTLPSSLFSPVQAYLDLRRDRLAAKVERRRQRAAARQAPFEEEPPTPPHRGALGEELELDVPELVRSHVSPELMREALELEAAELAGHDPTGSLIVEMLSKKLERLAAQHALEVKRNKRRRRKEKQLQQTVGRGGTATDGQEFAPQTDNILSIAESQKIIEAPEDSAYDPDFPQHTAGVWQRLSTLLHNPNVLAFLLLATLLGFGHGVIGTFLFMYLKHLGGGESLMGYVLMANALPELPVFYFFGSILHAVGMDRLLLVSTLGLGLRILAYTALPHVPLMAVLPLETIHALSYACGWSACAIKASKIAPPGLESTSQALFQGLWTGVGAGAGGLLGGLLYHKLGPEAVFRISGIIILVGCGVAGTILGILHRRQKQESKENGFISTDALSPLLVE